MTVTSSAAVGGTHLAYTDQGSGAPVLLMHPGFVADAMLPLLSEPAVERFRIIAYHRRGYGKSDRTAGPTDLPGHAADALGVLDTLGVERAHLVGHSFGALVAIEIALTAPQRVASLALMEPLLGFALEPQAAAFVAETVQVAVPRFVHGDPAGALDAWLTAAFGPGFREVLEQRLPGSWQQAVDDADAAFGGELAAVQAWPVGPADLARITAPTLSLTHADHRWPGFEQTHRFLLATIPGCEGVIVDVPSHLLQVADPKAVAEPVAAFLARHAARTA